MGSLEKQDQYRNVSINELDSTWIYTIIHGELDTLLMQIYN